jgi:hypothetical protein
MLPELRQLLTTLKYSQVAEERLQMSIDNFYIALSQASVAEVRVAVSDLATALALDNLTHAGRVAIVICGLMHQGYDCTPAIAPLINKLDYLLTMSGRLLAAAEREAGAPSDDPDNAELINRMLTEIARTNPIESAAWEALEELFYLSGVTLFCQDLQARVAAQHLRELTKPIEHYHSGAHWLNRILSVFSNEPILVIEPSTKLGFEGKMSGISGNFQLHTLLMDIFPQQHLWQIQRRVSKKAVDIAMGKGAQCDPHNTVSGVWNMYDWQAIQPDLTLPDPADYGNDRHWIWGEGCPADIPVFSGFRVILLGAPSYKRGFGAQRDFADLRAKITRDRLLNRQEVTTWLLRMAEER